MSLLLCVVICVVIYLKARGKFGCSFEHLKCDFMVLLMLCIAGPSPQILNLSVLNYWSNFVYQRYYASEVTDPKMSVLAMLDNLIKRTVLKIFKVQEKLGIRDIRDFIRLHDVESLCEMRRIKFLNKTRTLTHAILQSLTGQFYCVLFSFLALLDVL